MDRDDLRVREYINYLSGYGGELRYATCFSGYAVPRKQGREPDVGSDEERGLEERPGSPVRLVLLVGEVTVPSGSYVGDPALSRKRRHLHFKLSLRHVSSVPSPDVDMLTISISFRP